MSTPTYTSPWLAAGECIHARCTVRRLRHRHKSPHLWLAEGDRVTVHDPRGDIPGRVETVTDDHVWIQGPPLGGGDSRSWSWTVAADKLGMYVTKL